MAELIILAYFGGEMRRLPKPAAYIDVIDHDGCVIWLVMDISDNNLRIGSLYIVEGIIKIHQFSCGIVRYAEMNNTIRNSMSKPASYMVWLEGIIFISLV